MAESTETVEKPPAAPETREAVQEVAEQGGTPAQAQRAAEKAEQAARPDLTDEEVRRIAKAQVDYMDELGLFEKPEPVTPAPQAETQTTPATPEPAVPETEEKPGRRSIAQRYLAE